jgi:hypothetical protein
MKKLLLTVLAFTHIVCAQTLILDEGYNEAGGGGAYDESATSFTGDDYLTRGADLTGNTDGKKGTISFWAKMPSSSNDSHRYIYSNIGGYIKVIRMNSNTMRVELTDTGGTLRMRLESDTVTINEALGWFHYAASWDLVDPGANHVYINGTEAENVVTFVTDSGDADLIDYTRSNHYVGTDEDQLFEFNGCLSELYINLAEYVDLSVQANREKFRSAAGQPISLGADGSTPTGTAPIIYLKNASGTFQNNLGTGGNFSVTGTLTDCADEP